MDPFGMGPPKPGEDLHPVHKTRVWFGAPATLVNSRAHAPDPKEGQGLGSLGKEMAGPSSLDFGFPDTSDE